MAAHLYDLVFAVNATVKKIRGYCGRNYQDANYDRIGEVVNENTHIAGEIGLESK